MRRGRPKGRHPFEEIASHGGQFFPFNLLIHRFQPIVAGLHRVGRTWLYVNRGTGYWGPPSRLAVGGELTVIRLTSTRR